MSARQRGQISVGAVGLVLLLALGAGLLVRTSGVLAGGAHAQTAADLAALAAARDLAADPAAPAARLRRSAAGTAAANDGRLVRLRIGYDSGLPAAVEVVVRLHTGGGWVTLRSRAGVSYSASLDPTAFRPVALGGLRGAAGAVAAAEAQIGWPYVWGGESRAEGGFDCSGLIDFAYAAAGHPLPGRPTAADLYQLASPVAATDLVPGDLVFMGAPSGAPYHVGMYVGAGTVIAAPHTGAVVSFQPLVGGGWDGFGRLVDGGGPVLPVAAVESAARRYQVPTNVLQAELEFGLARAADAAARRLGAAQARHPGDLAAALADALGSPSRAALVLRAAAGPALGARFTGSVRLLPLDGGRPDDAAARLAGALTWRVPSAAAPVASGGGAGLEVEAAAGMGSNATDLAGRVAEGVGERASGIGRLASVFPHIGRGGLTVVSAFAPDRRIADLASFAGAVWDGTAAVAAIVSRAPPQMGVLARVAGGLGIAGGFLTALVGGVGLLRATTTRGRIRSGAMLASGLLVGGGGMLAGGVLVAAVPPVGLALIVAGTAIYAGMIVYDHWDGITSGVRAAAGAIAGAARRVGSAARRAAGAVAGAAGRAASAVGDAISSLSPF